MEKNKVIRWTRIEGTENWTISLDGEPLIVLVCPGGEPEIRQMLYAIFDTILEEGLAVLPTREEGASAE
ncbi:MAG: hypothetical protein AAGH40_01810 [Verrucomicrobiota bacterium]